MIKSRWSSMIAVPGQINVGKGSNRWLTAQSHRESTCSNSVKYSNVLLLGDLWDQLLGDCQQCVVDSDWFVASTVTTMMLCLVRYVVCAIVLTVFFCVYVPITTTRAIYWKINIIVINAFLGVFASKSIQYPPEDRVESTLFCLDHIV